MTKKKKPIKTFSLNFHIDADVATEVTAETLEAAIEAGRKMRLDSLVDFGDGDEWLDGDWILTGAWTRE